MPTTLAAGPIRVGIILAGGAGERFWPLSRRRRPKQLLRLTSPQETMLGEAVSRLAPSIPAERMYVVTGKHLVEPIRLAAIGIPEQNILAEPAKRNTAGALIYAAAHCLATFGGDGSNLTMAVTTADHMVGDPHQFQATVDIALRAAEEQEALVTLGIVPTRPETGFGYIQIDNRQGPLTPYGDRSPVYPVKAFHEKPNQKVAADFIATGHYYWNSGMFFWKVSTFLKELAVARPEFVQTVMDLAEALRRSDSPQVQTIFDSLEDISIDYALMEHAKHVMVVRAGFAWDDIGTWASLDRAQGHDPAGNVVVGDPILVDCEGCIVYNEDGAQNMAVCVIGCEDLVVVTTKDAVLVIPKNRAQDVRYAVQELKDRNAPQI